MKFIKTFPSGRDPDVPLYQFGINVAEMKLLHDLATDARIRLPKLTETSRVNMRLKNIVYVLSKGLKHNNERSNIK